MTHVYFYSVFNLSCDNTLVIAIPISGYNETFSKETTQRNALPGDAQLYHFLDSLQVIWLLSCHGNRIRMFGMK